MAHVLWRTAVPVAPGTANVTTRAFSRHASWLDGDVVFAHVSWTNGSAITPDAAWTLVGTVQSNGTNISIATYVRIMVTADTGPWTWTIGTGTRMGILTDAGTGIDSITPIQTSTTTVSGAALAVPAITTATKAADIMSIWAGRMTTTPSPTITPPGTHTTLTSTGSSVTGTTVQLAMAMAVLTTQPDIVGTFGPYTATSSAGLDAAAHRALAINTVAATGGAPTIAYTRTDVVEIIGSSDNPPPGPTTYTLTQTGGATATITQPTSGTFRIVLPTGFTGNLTFSLVGFANSLTGNTQTIIVGPGGGVLIINEMLTFNGTGWV